MRNEEFGIILTFDLGTVTPGDILAKLAQFDLGHYKLHCERPGLVTLFHSRQARVMGEIVRELGRALPPVYLNHIKCFTASNCSHDPDGVLRFVRGDASLSSWERTIIQQCLDDF
jgi:hypothetical protein